MGIQKQAGFTIIETTLFLAITGLLILGLIVGVSGSINVQRYRDSVESFKSLVQAQYSSLSSVQNGRSNSLLCDAGAIVSDIGAPQTRGQSNCLVVGKYMRIDKGDVSIYTVLANQVSSAGTTDIEIMANGYAINASSTEIEERQLEWGAEIAWTREGSLDRNPAGGTQTTPRTLGILFIRSPASGQVYTFTNNAIPDKSAITANTFRALIQADNRTERMVCIESGNPLSSGNMGVYINSYATTTGAIETRTNSYEGATKC